MFDARELSILISGSSTGFNVADLREHTVYAGGYTEAGQNFDALLLPFPVSHHSNLFLKCVFHPKERSQVIRWFWELLGQMEPEDFWCFHCFPSSHHFPAITVSGTIELAVMG